MKLKKKTMDRIKGSVSILLVLVMLPMMTLAAVIVDLSRINMARQMVSSAGSLAMNTELANYDTILKDVYGLFAMSQSREDAANRVQEYFEKTLVSYKIVEENEAGAYVQNLMGDFRELLAATDASEINDFIRLENVAAKAEGIPASSLSTPDILRKQIVEYMKYRAPIEFGMSFLDALKSFSTVSDQATVVEAQVKAQESTQDVTQACSYLIKLIREYDKLVDDLDHADPSKRVSYADAAGNAQYVQLADYDTHMSLLRDGRNMLKYHFQHLNRINLAFLDNNPNVDNVYLKDLPKDTCYIAEDGTLIQENSGISFQVNNLAGDMASAKQQMTDQINSLDNTYLPFANSYVSRNFISADYLASESDGTLYFTNEAAAINSFGDFERFLLSQSEIKYDDPNSNVDVKGTLDEIYRLGKYFENYKRFKDIEISNAQTAWSNALGARNERAITCNSVKNGLKRSVEDINKFIQELYPNLEDSKILNFLSNDKEGVLEILQMLSAPVEGAYRSYFAQNLTNAGFPNNYAYYFEHLLNHGDLKGTEIGNAAKDYSGNAADFEKYMKEKLGNGVTGKDEYKLLKLLLQCGEQADSFGSKLGEYDTAKSLLDEATAEANRKEAEYNSKVTELENVRSNMTNCTKKFINFVRTYQDDAYTFGRYIQAARDVINDDIAGVQVSYLGMVSNTKELIDKQQAILDQIDVTIAAIQTYNNNLDAWENSNDTYINTYGKDSFSKQTAADVETARSEYDDQLFLDLKNFVESLKIRFDTFYGYLMDVYQNRYGIYHIALIMETQSAVEAVAGKRGSESIVTAQMADDKFDSLFVATPSEPFEPYTIPQSEQLGFLSPTVIQYQALKYLDSAYPVQKDEVDIGLKDEDGNTVDAETRYEELTKELNDKSGGAVENTDDVFQDDSDGSPDTTDSNNKFGYTYAEKSIKDKAGLPSNGSGPDDVTGAQYKMSKGEEDVNVSGGMSDQMKALKKVLGKIGEVLNAGMENLYILTYLFENFSYNTMVQDAMVAFDKKQENPKLGSDPFITDALHLMNDTDTLDGVKDRVPMLSGGYVKNGKNNYLYGAEVEYILYGNPNPQTNVTSAKASIYAVRFGFNCIFVFTDSTIRNATMSAGLAVQAATCGLIPYQVVQVVLQLALAAAESALDMEMMNCGIRVAVVKSKDTWLLSVSNAAEALADIAADAASQAINDLTTGIQDLVDAKAEDMKAAIEDLGDSITSSTQKAMEDIMNHSIGYVTKTIEKKINELQYITDQTREGVSASVNAAFDGLEAQINAELEALYAENELAGHVLPMIQNRIGSIIENVKTEIQSVLSQGIDDPNDVVQDYGKLLIGELNTIKSNMILDVTSRVEDMTNVLHEKANSLVTELQGGLDAYIGQAGREISEQTAELIRNEVMELTNGFINDYLGGGAGIGTGNVGANSSVAAAIKFGYKDYLMLFTYIAICTDDAEVLLRTADIIQLNLQNAAADAQFEHPKGADFKMSEAFTYVLVTGSAELDLLLMDFDLFANMVADEDGSEPGMETEDGENRFLIEYAGMLGY